LSVIFHLNGTNEDALFSVFSKSPVLIFFYRASSPFCSHLFRPWRELCTHFQNSSDLTLAGIDCNDHPSTCKHYLKSTNEFPVFLQKADFRRIEISFGPDFPSMLNYANSLLSLKTKQICRRFNGSLPAILFKGHSDSAVCPTIRHISLHVPDHVDSIFWLDGGLLSLELEFIDMVNRSIQYRGPHRSLSYVNFIREYTLPQWGTWDPIQVRVSRYVVFLVYSNVTQKTAFHGTFPDLAEYAVFGSLHVELFRQRYGTVNVRDADLPLMCVTGNRGRFLVLRMADPRRERFRYLLKLAVTGRMESSMRYVLKPPQKAPLQTENRMRIVVCGGIAGGSLLGLIGIILNRARSCVRPKRRRSTLFS
jgi:hypothetical protein